MRLVVKLIVLILVAGALAFAQQAPQKPSQKPLFTPTPNPAPAGQVVSGDDIGFRIDGYKKGVPVGRMVIKVDGKWVEPLEAPSVVLAR